MKRPESDDLSPDERAAYSALANHPVPPPELEEKIVDELRRRSRLRAARPGPQRRFLNTAAAVAAGAILLVLGGLGQRYLLAPSGQPASAPTFILLLREPRPLAAPPGGDAETVMYREYSAWARAQAGAGRLLGGERLASGGRIVGVAEEEGAGDSAAVTGYFLLDVGTVEEAERIARSCPHVKYGGEIEIRRIDRL